MSLNCSPATNETETAHAAAKGATAATPRPCAYEQCGKPFTPARADARFCSPACRLKAHRTAKAQDTVPVSAQEAEPAKPKRNRPGGHRPDGSTRFNELRRQAETEAAERLANIHQQKLRKPSVPYSDALGEAIAERLKDGESLKSICSSHDMPDESAVRGWAEDLAHPFSPIYVRARHLGYLKLADELDDLASGADLGERRFESGVVQRHRLQVETRKWTLAKMLPRVFGDKVDLTSAGQQITQISLPDLELARRAMHWMTSLKSQDVIDAEVVAIEDKSEEGKQP